MSNARENPERDGDQDNGRYFKGGVDFINIFPPTGIVNALIVISPGHMKRIIRALNDNVLKYESKFGEIKEAPEPKDLPSA
jgi:hypothetical protein